MPRFQANTQNFDVDLDASGRNDIVVPAEPTHPVILAMRAAQPVEQPVESAWCFTKVGSQVARYFGLTLFGACLPQRPSIASGPYIDIDAPPAPIADPDNDKNQSPAFSV